MTIEPYALTKLKNMRVLYEDMAVACYRATDPRYVDGVDLKKVPLDRALTFSRLLMRFKRLGNPPRDIARLLEVAESTVERWLRRGGPPRKGNRRIASLQTQLTRLLHEVNAQITRQKQTVIDAGLLLEPGYHLNRIIRGVPGEISKIREELDELEDADDQSCRVMQLVELADLYGAIELFLEKSFPGFRMADLADMARITRRAFESGARK